MTSKEFVLWLKGFTDGVHEFNATPKQWDKLKDKLAEVKDDPIGTPIGQGGWGTPNTAPIMPLPYYPNPLDNHWKVTCQGPETPCETLTTSSGSSGTIAYGFAVTATPGYGSVTYNPSTTTTGYSSGSAWSYTNNTGGNRWTEYQATMSNYRPYQPYTTGGEDEVIKHHNED